MSEKQKEQNLNVSKEAMVQLISEAIDTVNIGDRIHSTPIVECYEEYDIYVGDNNELTIRIAPPEDYFEMVDERLDER